MSSEIVGAGQRAHDDAGQHQDEDRLATADRGGDEIDQRHRGDPAGEGQKLDAEDRQGQEDAEDRAEAGPGAHAQDVGRHQRVAEQVLIGGTGRGQRRADGERGCRCGAAGR